MRRFPRVGAIVLLVSTPWACAGTLDDPARFLDAAPDAGEGEGEAGLASSTDASTAPGADCPSIPGVFAQTCTASSCHSASTKAQGLDLQSPGLAARLVGVPATEGPGLLIDPAAPSQSVVYSKLQADPAFGARMPLGAAPLDSGTVACVLAWITQAAASAQGDGGAASNAGSGGAAGEDGSNGDPGGDDGSTGDDGSNGDDGAPE